MEYPITVTKVGDTHKLVCQCGANKTENFVRLLRQRIEIDERGRKKPYKEWELMCSKCKTSIGYDVLNEQYKKDTQTVKVSEEIDTPTEDKNAPVVSGWAGMPLA